MTNTYKCHTICGGVTPETPIKGEILISRDPVCFYMIDHDTGAIIENGHDLNGKSIQGKILVIPSGKGSSVVQDEGLFALRKNETGPLAIIVNSPDTVLVAGALVMDFPIFDKVDELFYNNINNGGIVEINVTKSMIALNVE